jgi:hypothetical protein
MSTTEPGSGWLPAEAAEDLEADRDKVSRAAADRLLDLSPRARVIDLMRLAAAGEACEAPLRPDDLARLLASFEGDEALTVEEMCGSFPGAVAGRD